MYQVLKQLIFIGFLLPLTVWALPEDSEKTIHIVADASEFNYKTGVDTYEGNVRIDQGTTHLRADRLVTQKNEHHKIVSAIAYGVQRRAKYSTIPKEGDLVLNAEAKVIKYFPVTATIILEDDVRVTQGENSFNGPHIIYNMKDQTVSAPASKNGRATIIIEPKQLKS